MEINKKNFLLQIRRKNMEKVKDREQLIRAVN